MKKSRLDLPHIKLFIANGVAYGKPQRQLAKELNTSQPAISRMAKRDDVRSLIQEEEKKFYKQMTKILEKIHNDPAFLATFQKQFEEELLSFRWLSQS